MAMNLKPLADRVIVRALEPEDKTAGGLYIPDSAKEKPQQGEVMAVGPGRIGDDGKCIKPEVKVGDKILYGKYSGTEVNVGAEDYLIMRENDIFAIIG